MPTALTVPELAERWHCSTKTIRRMLDARVFSSIRVTRNTILIPTAEIEAHEKRRTVKAARRIAA